ncbi:MAG TPA: MBL fold metallo-hydrolase, partial [Pseudomonadales bacterium]
MTPAKEAKLTYLANEGVMITWRDEAVLIDALFRGGVAGYATLDPKTRDDLESARAPFDRVQAILVTHFHADHLDPEAVVSHLTA